MKQFSAIFCCLFFSMSVVYSQSTLSTEEKLYGLSTLWQEVNYNFAFFDQVPYLNWEKEYKQAINQVIASESDLDYYHILQKLTAKLQDGHTQVYLPDELEKQLSTLKIQVQEENGLYYITDIAKKLQGDLPLGSVITHINQQPVDDYINQHVAPFIASSTSQGLKDQIERRLFYGAKGEQLSVTVSTPDNQKKDVDLTRHCLKYGDWVNGTTDDLADFTYHNADNVSIVTFNSFENKQVVEEFEDKIDEINNSKGLIIDLRENIGGQSVVGLNIAKYLVRNNHIVDMRWKSKQHIASHKAWGNSGLQLMGYDNIKEYEDFGDLNAWIEIAPDTLFLDERQKKVTIPVHILISERTASSAENFLVFIDGQKHITTFGSKTFGSTGQPIYFELPGNGYARICAKRNYYPDGREFVGYGIQPEVPVNNSIRDIISNRDHILQTAVSHFTK